MRFLFGAQWCLAGIIETRRRRPRLLPPTAGFAPATSAGSTRTGIFILSGGAKDVIVLPSGKNVHPEDIEAHYLKCPLVAELAVIGVEDETESRAGAEKLAAVVVPDFAYLKQAGVANSKEAIRHALDNLGRELPEYQRVRDYLIRIEPLPRTATNKIKRFQLKKEVETGEIAADTKPQTSWKLTDEDNQLLDSNIAKAVLSAIRQNAGDAEVIHPTMNLEIDLGLDSLARAEVFAALEHAYSARISCRGRSQCPDGQGTYRIGWLPCRRRQPGSTFDGAELGQDRTRGR